MSFFDVFVRVFPIAMLAALSPFNVAIILVLLLNNQRPVARAISFLAGFITCLIVIGILALAFIPSLQAPALRPRAYLVITTLGAVLVFVGVRQLATAIDVEEPPKKWLDRIAEFGPYTAFWVGLFVSGLGLKTMGIYVASLGIITTSNVGFVEALILGLVVILTISWSMWLPILIYVLQPERKGQILERLQHWLYKQEPRVAGSILVLIGVVLVIAGIQGML